MNIEHCGLLSWVHARHESPAHKSHAQDCGTLSAFLRQRPAILPWSRYAGCFHPHDWIRGRGIFGLETRATGTLPVIVQSPECCWTNFYPNTGSTRRKNLRKIVPCCEPVWLAYDARDPGSGKAEKPLFRNHARTTHAN